MIYQLLTYLGIWPGITQLTAVGQAAWEGLEKQAPWNRCQEKNAVRRVGSRAGMSTGMAHDHKAAGSPSGVRRDLLGYNKNVDGQKILGKVVSSSWLALFQEGRWIRAWQSLKPQTAGEF